MSDIAKEAAAAIRAKRLAARLSQTQLAEVAGVSQQHISMIERGIPSTLTVINRVVDALGITVEFK